MKRLIILYLLIPIAVVIILIGFSSFYIYYHFARNLKSTEAIMNYKDSGLMLTDRNGKDFFSFYQAKTKKYIPLDQISKNLQNAIIASEDKDFYKHGGFSIQGIIRSFLLNFQNKEIVYGGSTITQQLVKNSLLTSEKSYWRKYEEIVLAQEIERRYSKKEILTMYLNSVYFGEGAFGAEAASRTYFGKMAKDLNLAESAFLTGLLPAPTRLSPFSGDLTQAKIQQRVVSQRMLENGYLNKEQIKDIEQTKLVFNNTEDINSIAPHFAIMVRDELIKKYGEEAVVRGGFEVTTSLDLKMQEYAEEVVREQVANLKYNNVSNGAAVVLDPKTGEILVMVGSVNWYDDKFGKVNIALSERQPGSSFKPIVYSKAIEDRLITPVTILQDSPRTYLIDSVSRETYSPRDYDGKFRGPVTVRRALSNSLNVPAVQVISMIGVKSGIEMAERLGITTLRDHSRYGLSLVLGAAEVKPLELANVYATFANSGYYNPPTSIIEIKNKYDRQIYKYTPNPKQVMEPEAAFLISSILSDNRTRSETFGNALTISRQAAVKTGTTENYRDAWTLGYTPSLAIGVWVGNNDGALMDSVAGALGPAPIWRELMEHYLEGTPVEDFVPPSGIVSSTTCILNANQKIATPSASFSDYFIEGTQPNICNPKSVSSTSAPAAIPTISPTPIPITSVAPTTVVTPPSQKLKIERIGPLHRYFFNKKNNLPGN